MKTYHVTTSEHSAEYIFENRLFNVYVIGLPRSGTSMMASCVKELGVNLVTSSEHPVKKGQLEDFYKEALGEYHPNENGFHEIADNFAENFLELFKVPYSGCKMIMPVGGIRLDILRTTPCKVVCVHRDLREVSDSHEAFYGIRPPIGVLNSVVTLQLQGLRKANVPIIEVGYNDVLVCPVKELTKIADFIGSSAGEAGIKLAVKKVNSKLRRFKA